MDAKSEAVRLRAELLERIGEIRRVAALDRPTDPADAVGPLPAELEAARSETDPIPRPPFPSHRASGVGLIRKLKEVLATLLRPFTRFLFQRQADFNRRVVALEEHVLRSLRALAERQARQDERIRHWSDDLQRAREERLAVLAALEQMSAELLELRAGSGGSAEPEAPDSLHERLDRLERHLAEVVKHLAPSQR